jgi:phosphohistidine phosphatase
MKSLLILRHGKSSWDEQNLADHDRPLKNRGKQDAPCIGELMRKDGLVPGVIISSTAKRAKDTAKLVADACGFDGEIHYHRALYHGSTGDYIELIRAIGGIHDIVLIVGHNPGLEELLFDITEMDELIPTATLAHIGFEIASWEDLDENTGGKLLGIWRPRDLG